MVINWLFVDELKTYIIWKPDRSVSLYAKNYSSGFPETSTKYSIVSSPRFCERE